MGHPLARWIFWIVLFAIALCGIVIAAYVGHLIYLSFAPLRVTVEGQVADSRGRPLAGAQVCAVPAEALNYSFGGMNPDRVTTTIVTTDANGRYELRRLNGGRWPVGDAGRYVQTYNVVAKAKGYAPQTFHIRHIPMDLPIREGSDRAVYRKKVFTNINFALERATSVSLPAAQRSPQQSD